MSLSLAPPSSVDADARAHKRDVRAFAEWKASAPLLYDLCSSYGLTWPSLTAQWMPSAHNDSASEHTLRMLMGTQTSGEGPDFIHVASVRMPNARASDPLAEFFKHPIAESVRGSQSSAAASSSAAAASSKPAAAAFADDDEYTGALPFYGSYSVFVTHKIRTQHELHRIRPLNASFTRNLAATSALVPVAEDESMSDDVAASPAPPSFSKSIAAAKGPDAAIKIYDIPPANGERHDDPSATSSRKRSASSVGSGKDARDYSIMTLTGATSGGWALDWNVAAADPALLVSGDESGTICVWNLEDAQTGLVVRPGAAASSSAVASARPSASIPLAAQHTWIDAHVGSINDIAWLKLGCASSFVSVGDDQRLNVFDTRQRAPAHSVLAHAAHVNTVSTSPFQEHMILTGASDSLVRLWDIRSLKQLDPLRTFVGHGGEVQQIAWAPFDHHNGSVFASSAADKRIFLWDISLLDSAFTQADLDESGPAELLFVHAGHSEKIEEFSFHPTLPWLIASIAQDNVMQVWQIASGLYEEVDERDLVTLSALKDIQSQPEASSSEHFHFDVTQFMQAIPADMHSAAITQATAPLLQSASLAPVSAFVKNYAANVDAALSAMPNVVAGTDSSSDESRAASPTNAPAGKRRQAAAVVKLKQRRASPPTVDNAVRASRAAALDPALRTAIRALRLNHRAMHQATDKRSSQYRRAQKLLESAIATISGFGSGDEAESEPSKSNSDGEGVAKDSSSSSSSDSSSSGDSSDDEPLLPPASRKPSAASSAPLKRVSSATAPPLVAAASARPPPVHRHEVPLPEKPIWKLRSQTDEKIVLVDVTFEVTRKLRAQLRGRRPPRKKAAAVAKPTAAEAKPVDAPPPNVAAEPREERKEEAMDIDEDAQRRPVLSVVDAPTPVKQEEAETADAMAGTEE